LELTLFAVLGGIDIRIQEHTTLMENMNVYELFIRIYQAIILGREYIMTKWKLVTDINMKRATPTK
jgi:hypothetical protein